MDGDAIVEMALTWENVPEKNTCEIFGIKQKNELNNRKAKIVDTDVAEIMFDVSDCKIDSLEHVQAIINVEHPNRGALEVVLVSAAGTKTRLLAPRPKDTSEKGFSEWPLMSVETWGETPVGFWQLYIVNRREGEESTDIDWSVGDCRLLLHGLEKSGKPDINLKRKNKKQA